MKFSRKAMISIAVIVVLMASGLLVFTQFLGQPKEIVVLETSMGTIEIQLDRQHAPITVNNFVTYVKAGFYDGTVFHRVMPGFIVQAGGFIVNNTEKTTNAPIKLESTNLDYSSQNQGYAVFGKVISGLDVVSQIGKVQTSTRNVTISGYGVYPFTDWPVQDIVITKAYMKP